MRSIPLFLLAFALGISNTFASPAITEFMAANSATLADEDGEFTDWIEITNTGPGTIDMAGWFLTDDVNSHTTDPQSVWTFPARSIASGEGVVVFASGKDRTGTELHTNFQLSSNGEYLALVAPDGTTIATEFSPEYPDQETDISYGPGQVSLTNVELLAEGDPVLVKVPANGADGTQWAGGAEPFDDTGWTARNTGIGYDTGDGPSGFALLESFDSLNLGALAGQGGWSASSGGATVAVDPANAENQVMSQSGSSVLAWKALGIPNGSTSTVFFRTRRDGSVNISVGTSDKATPGTAFSCSGDAGILNDDVCCEVSKLLSGEGITPHRAAKP